MDATLYGPNGPVLAEADAHKNLKVVQGGSAYEAAVERGNVFLTANQATVTTQAGLSATTPVLTIANKNGSKKVVKIWYAGCVSLVAAAAAAAVWAAFGDKHATAVTGTAAVVRNAKTGVTGDPSGIACFLAATLPAAPVAVAQLGAITTAAITTNPEKHPISRWFNGALWIPEGCNFSIQLSTAGTLFCDYIFEVVDD